MTNFWDWLFSASLEKSRFAPIASLGINFSFAKNHHPDALILTVKFLLKNFIN